MLRRTCHPCVAHQTARQPWSQDIRGLGYVTAHCLHVCNMPRLFSRSTVCTIFSWPGKEVARKTDNCICKHWATIKWLTKQSSYQDRTRTSLDSLISLICCLCSTLLQTPDLTLPWPFLTSPRSTAMPALCAARSRGSKHLVASTSMSA